MDPDLCGTAGELDDTGGGTSAAEVGGCEVTGLVEVSEVTEVTLVSEVEGTAAFADELVCESGYATAIATTTTAPTAASTTARRRPSCAGGSVGSDSGSALSGASEPR